MPSVVFSPAVRAELIEARDEKRLLRYQKHLSRQDLLIVDELGYWAAVGVIAVGLVAFAYALGRSTLPPRLST